MLVRFFGRNFRSLKGPFELSMVAADFKGKEDRDRGVATLPLRGSKKKLRLLRVAAIYGANASGKSTVLLASRALRWLAIDSVASSRPDAPIPTYDPFLLDKATKSGPIELGCEVVHDDSLLRYEVHYDHRAVLQETLTRTDGMEEVTLIDRQGENVQGHLIDQSKVNPLYVQDMQANVTVLSKLAQFGPAKGKDSIKPYYQAIRNATCQGDYLVAMDPPGFDQVEGRFVSDRAYREWVMSHLMRAADVGIRDAETGRRPLVFPQWVREAIESAFGDRKLPKEIRTVSFVHDGKDPAPIELDRESAGTRKLLRIADDWWTLAHETITLFADELSASLHPRLLAALIRGLNDDPSDHRSQLIFATHDTGLLESQDGGPPALRRDQVYFTRKDALGASELYSLAEFKEEARTVHNIRKRYLSGLYGAIPLLDKLRL